MPRPTRIVYADSLHSKKYAENGYKILYCRPCKPDSNSMESDTKDFPDRKTEGFQPEG